MEPTLSNQSAESSFFRSTELQQSCDETERRAQRVDTAINSIFRDFNYLARTADDNHRADIQTRHNQNAIVVEEFAAEVRELSRRYTLLFSPETIKKQRRFP